MKALHQPGNMVGGVVKQMAECLICNLSLGVSVVGGGCFHQSDGNLVGAAGVL